MAEAAIAAAGEDYNVYVPIQNALGALGKKDAAQQRAAARDPRARDAPAQVPEDARRASLLAADYASAGRTDDALREVNLAMALRSNEATVLYNAACVYCQLGRKPRRSTCCAEAWEAGFKDAHWARRDPDLAILHGDPEFETLYPPEAR